MRYILLILFSVSILTACVSPSKRIYWHPEAPGGVIETYDDIIYAHDYNIPTRGIVFQAPNDVEFRIISHEVNDPGLIVATTYSGFAIAINIPEGVVVKFLSKNFRIIDKRSGEIFIHQQEEIVDCGFKITWFDAGYITDPDIRAAQYRSKIPFMDQLVGSNVVKVMSIVPGNKFKVKYKKPYLIIFNVKHNDLNEYSIEIPPMLINGKTFQIPIINFRKKEGSFLLKIH